MSWSRVGCNHEEGHGHTGSAVPTQVVVVGAGMAGIAAVRALRRAPVEVRVIDAHNYSTFAPLLFQVATCFISPDEVAIARRAEAGSAV